MSDDKIKRKVDYTKTSEVKAYEPSGDEERVVWGNDVRTEKTRKIKYSDQHGNAVVQTTTNVSYTKEDRDLGTFGKDEYVRYKLKCPGAADTDVDAKLFNDINKEFGVFRRNNALNWADYYMDAEPTVNLPSPNPIEQACKAPGKGKN